MKKIDKRFLINDTLTSIVIIIDYLQADLSKIIEAIDKEIQARSSLYEIICIDNTGLLEEQKQFKKIQQKNLHSRFIHLSKQYPHDIALTVGIDSCIGDYVIFYDLSSDTPDIINTLLEQLVRGYDIVIGSAKSRLKHLTILSQLFLRLIVRISQQGYFYRSNYTVGLSRRAVLAMTRTRRKNRNFSYLNSLIGLKKIIIEYWTDVYPVSYFARNSFIQVVISVLNDVISNSFKPIRWISLLGMLGSTLFLLYIFIIIVLVVFFNMRWIAPQGWISLATVMGGMFFLLFSCLTIMSEYLIRIMDEARDEPLYFISHEIDGSHRTLKNLKKKRSNRLNIVKI
jgi:dolichol-phosphate mannosyltransferase